MNYQIVVINASKQRKKEMENQFNLLNLHDKVNIVYLPAATPENSQHYLPTDGYTDQQKKYICCGLSHLYCLEFACLRSSPEFTVILEDDVALHKIHFTNAIEELIEKWNSFHIFKIASLGWVPADTRGFFDRLKYIPLHFKEDTRLIPIYVSGFQAYIVRKKDIQPILPTLLYPTYKDFENYVEEYKKKYNMNWLKPISIDSVLNGILKQCAVYPPVVIERKTESLLEHNNWGKYWNKWFADPYSKRLDEFNL
jgi:hypothetical protein